MSANIHNVRMTYRLPFRQHNVKSGDTILNVRPFNHLVRLLVLDLKGESFSKLFEDAPKFNFCDSCEAS